MRACMRESRIGFELSFNTCKTFTKIFIYIILRFGDYLLFFFNQLGATNSKTINFNN